MYMAAEAAVVVEATEEAAMVVAIEKACRRESVHECALTAHGLAMGPRTVGREERSREERQTYGELRKGSTRALVERLQSIGEPALRLGRNSSFLDIGCGFGQVVLQVSVRVPQAECVGMELVPFRLQGARKALSALRAEGLPLSNVTFEEGDACELLKVGRTPFTHVYAFDLCFEEETLQGMADVLSSIPFAILASFHTALRWTKRGLRVKEVGRIKPAYMALCKERHTLYLLMKDTCPRRHLSTRASLG